jgi:hypothetical protein
VRRLHRLSRSWKVAPLPACSGDAPVEVVINVALDGCVDHEAIPADEELYR